MRRHIAVALPNSSARKRLPLAASFKSLYAALTEFGAPLEGLKAEDFMEPDLFFPHGRTPAAGGYSPGDPRYRF
ncbi:MAG: hypothetical protein DMG57_23385 [Acidobacteria bacterium]|nr:MAG: hypothetical protein DMG57_23385 [Acidobacteriota bacterium]